ADSPYPNLSEHPNDHLKFGLTHSGGFPRNQFDCPSMNESFVRGVTQWRGLIHGHFRVGGFGSASGLFGESWSIEGGDLSVGDLWWNPRVGISLLSLRDRDWGE
ncbi:MAG: hypothetical protein KDA36_07610, partial [Planctomycetaceae bacterium]|nr:hypothetical protein [Planctomycetaceae bacterium]